MTSATAAGAVTVGDVLLCPTPISRCAHAVRIFRYNAALRGHARASQRSIEIFEDLNRGNRYTTTLYVINSAVLKMSKLTIARPVYRGYSGGSMPAAFQVANGFGVRGGVESAFMSTTTDRSVAMGYASHGSVGIVIEMEMGMVDRGAELSWLSQYPHEQV